MNLLHPESVVRWLDDLDGAAYALRLMAKRTTFRRLRWALFGLCCGALLALGSVQAG